MALTKASRSMLNTGISDSSDATALTFSSAEDATFAGHISLADSKKIKLGASSDLEIYHDGTHSYVADEGQGNLIIEGNNVRIQANGGAGYAFFTSGGAADLYHNGSIKLSTASDGIDVTGKIDCTTFESSGVATIGGNLTVTGNLQVDGTTTTINSTNYTVDDKNITLASGAGSSSAADGGGITIDGANATWNYVHSTTSWDSNKPIRSTNGFVGPLTGNVTGNASGTAATVTGAAQSAITSVGTLTALTVDDITIDSSTISDAGDLTITGETIALRTDSSSLATALSIDAAHNTTLAGHLIVNGNTTLGNADTDTVTIPGPLAVDTDTLYVDVTNDRVSINSGTSPSEALHVTGNIKATGNAYANRFILDAPTSGGTRYLYTDNTNTGTGRLVIQSGGGSAGYGGGLSLFSHSHASKPGWVTAGLSLDAGTTDASSEARFTVNTQGHAGGTDLFTVLRSGKVGIGTTTPGSLLNIRTSSAASYPILIEGDIDNDGGYTGIQFGYNNTGYNKAAIHVEGTSGNVQPEMHFLLNSAASSANTQGLSDAKMSILNSGLVGIGETTPDSALHIKQSNNSAGDLWTGTGPGNVPGITIQNAGTTDNNHAAVYFKDNDGHRAAISARFENHSTNKTHLGFSTTDSSGNGRQRVKLTSNDQSGADFIGEEGPNAVSSTAGDNWSLIADRAMEVIQDNNNASSWITMKQFRLTNNAKSLSVKWAAKNQSGTYYWAWRILRNGSVTNMVNHGGGNAQKSYSYGLASGESSSVHAFRSYDVDIGEAYAGDEITLQMVNSTGGGTAVAGTQYLYCKQFEVTTLDYAKAQVDRHGTIRRPLVRGAIQTTGYGGNEYAWGTIEIPFGGLDAGTHNIIELAEFDQATVGHAELHFAGLYAYAGRNFCQGITMSSTRRRSSNTDWEDIDGGTVYFTQGANGDVTAPDFYWSDGVLKVGVSSSVQITGYMKITWRNATIQRHYDP